MPASISSNTIVSPPRDGRDRERDPRQLAAGGGLGDRAERQPGVRPDQEGDLVGAGRARVGLAQLGAELAVAEADADQLARDRRSESGRRRTARRSQLARAGASTSTCARSSASAAACAGSWPSSSAASSRRASSARSSSSVVGLHPVAALRVGDPVELGLDRLHAIRLGLERREERPQVGRRLAQRELGRAQRLAGRGELRREPLERRDRALGRADEVGRAVVVLGRERRRGCRGACCELCHVTQPLALGAQLVLQALLETLGVGAERAQLVERAPAQRPSRASARRAGAAR